MNSLRKHLNLSQKRLKLLVVLLSVLIPTVFSVPFLTSRLEKLKNLHRELGGLSQLIEIHQLDTPFGKRTSAEILSALNQNVGSKIPVSLTKDWSALNPDEILDRLYLQILNDSNLILDSEDGRYHLVNLLFRYFFPISQELSRGKNVDQDDFFNELSLSAEKAKLSESLYSQLIQSHSTLSQLRMNNQLREQMESLRFDLQQLLRERFLHEVEVCQWHIFWIVVFSFFVFPFLIFLVANRYRVLLTKQYLRIIHELARKTEDLKIYKELIESSPDVFGLANPQGRPLFVNQAGQKRGWVPGKKSVFRQVASEKALEIYQKEVIPLAQQGKVWEGEIVLRDLEKNEDIYFFQKVFPLISETGELKYLATIASDLTATREKQSEIESLEHRVEFVLSVARMALFDWDIEKDTLWGPGMPEVAGLQDKTAGAYSAWVSTLHPDDRSHAVEAVQSALAGTKEFNTRFRVIMKDGSVRHIRALGSVTRDAEGRALRLTGINADITQEALWQEEIQRQKTYIEGILNAIPDPVFVSDENHRWIYGNEAFSKIIDQPLESYRGKRSHDFFPPEVADKFHQRDEELLSSAQAQEFEDIVTHPNGSTQTILTKVTPVGFQDGRRILIGVIRDISTRRSLERELELSRSKQVEAARMASLGEMAGGVAHEINNPLAIIMGKSYALMTYLSESADIDRDKILKDVEKIEKVSERIATIIRGLRNFSRDGEKDPLVRIKIQNAIEDALVLCSERFRNHSVHLKFVGFEHPLYVRGRHTQLSQVVLNLLANAFDAVHGRPQPEVTLELALEGENIFLRISDNGPGISKDIEQKIMEPFFTTKEVGKGTGLGLSISLGIAKQHGGILRLNRAYGNSCFELQLPALVGRNISPEL